MLHPRNVPFTEPGVSALDAYDGVVEVASTTDLDVDTDGVYTLTYSATDSSGNTATATRQVEVIPAVSILMASASGITGTEVSIPFTVKNFEAISGFQFSLTWDPEVVQLVMDESDSTKAKLSQVALINVSGVDFPMINSSQLEWRSPGLLTGLRGMKGFLRTGPHPGR